MADSRADELIKRASKCEEDDLQQHTLHESLAEIFYPERQDFVSQQSAGQERVTQLFNGYPAKLRYDLASAYGVMAHPRGQEWCKAKAFPRYLNEDDEVSKWCEGSSRTLMEVIYDPPAQWSRSANEEKNDYVAFGTSIQRVTYNRAFTGVLFKTLHLRSVSFQEDSEGEPDIVYERPEMTAYQIGQLWGKLASRLPTPLADAIEKEPTKKFTLLRCVFPISDYEYARGVKAPAGARFLSLYIEPQSRAILPSRADGDEAHFYTLPYVIRRAFTVSGEKWGRSPCTMLALADSRASQTLRRALLEAIEKAVDPPMIAKHDGVLGDFNFMAGGITFARKDAMNRELGDPVKPLQTGAMPNYGLDMEERTLEFLRACFHQNILRLPVDTKMTAYEISERLEEHIRGISPIIEPMEADNARVAARVWDLAERQGAFGQRPRALRGAEIRFDFETAMTVAQNKRRAQEAERVLTFTQVAAGLDKGALARVDFQKIQKDWMKATGHADWLKDDADADAAEEAMSQQDQIAQIAMLAKQSGAVDLLKTQMQQQGAAPEVAGQEALADVPPPPALPQPPPALTNQAVM